MVPKSVTKVSNGVMAIISHYFTEFGSFWANYVKVVEDRPIFSVTDVVQKNLAFSDMYHMAIFAEVTENECIIDMHLRGIHPLPDYDGFES